MFFTAGTRRVRCEGPDIVCTSSSPSSVGVSFRRFGDLRLGRLSWLGDLGSGALSLAVSRKLRGGVTMPERRAAKPLLLTSLESCEICDRAVRFCADLP